MDNPDILKAELNGLRRMVMEDADLRETRERIGLLRQSIAEEQQQIQRIQRRKEWVRRFTDIQQMLDQHQQEAQTASRHWASMGNERNQISLYDRVQPLRPLYDKISATQEFLTKVRNYYNASEQEIIAARTERDRTKDALDVAQQRLTDANEAFSHRLTDINVGYHIEGTIIALEQQLRQQDTLLNQLQLALNDKEQTLRAIRTEEANNIRETEAANTLVKGLSAHSVMLGLYDLVKDKLSAMAKERRFNDKLREEQENIKNEQMLQQQSLRQREAELSRLEQEYDHHRAQLLILNQNCDTTLDIVRAPIARDGDETRRQIDRFLDLRAQIRLTEEQIQVATLQINAKRALIEEIRTESAIVESRRVTLEQSIRESNTEMTSLYTDLDKIITLSGWFSEWQHNPDHLRSRISELYHAWQNARNRHAETSRSTALLRQSLATAEQSVAEARQQEVQQRNVRDGLRRSLEDHKERMRALFGEEKPADVEKGLRQEIAQAQSNVAEAHTALFEAQKHYSNCKARQKTLLALQQEVQEELRMAGAEFDLQLENKNTSDKQLLQRSIVEDIFQSSADWAALRNSLTDAERQQATTAIRLEDTQARLSEIQCEAATNRPGSADTEELLQLQIEEAHKHLQKYQEEFLEASGKLYAHENALRRITNLMR